jgi:hypothetical protein
MGSHTGPDGYSGPGAWRVGGRVERVRARPVAQVRARNYKIHYICPPGGW